MAQGDKKIKKFPSIRGKKRIHGSYFGKKQYEKQLEEAEIPKYQKRKIEQELRRKRKKRGD